MKASLKMLGFVSLILLMMMAVFLPFANPWWFLLSIPLFMILPHMDKMMNYLTDWMIKK